MNTKRRLLSILVLLAVLFVLGSAYATAEFRSYPSESDIVDSPDEYDGEHVFLFKDIQSIADDRETMVVSVRESRVVGGGVNETSNKTEFHQNVTVQLHNASISGTLETGAAVQVYGDLRSQSTTIAATTVVVDYQNAADYRYMYGISVLGGLAGVGYFLKQWRINLWAVCFESRGRE